MKRYFAFGCSYAEYQWPMLPDLIGVNFNEYYNFGVAGACHQYMLTQLIQANELYTFNKDTDYITIGTTGFGRFSYVSKEQVQDWKLNGDIFPEYVDHPDKARLWAREFDSRKWSVYRSLSSLKSMIMLLNSMGMKYKIYSSLYNKHLDTATLDRHPLDNETIQMINEFNSSIQTKESVDEYLCDWLSTRGEYTHPWIDGHPPLHVSYRYLQNYFPEFDTDETKKVYNQQLSAMQSMATKHEYEDFYLDSYKRKYRTDYDYIFKVKHHPYYVTKT